MSRGHFPIWRDGKVLEDFVGHFLALDRHELSVDEFFLETVAEGVSLDIVFLQVDTCYLISRCKTFRVFVFVAISGFALLLMWCACYIYLIDGTRARTIPAYVCSRLSGRHIHL